MIESTGIAIIGGGPVGASAALALHARGFDVALLEARDADAAPGDPRTLALSHGSRLILERLGCWHLIEEVTPIETIHVSQRGRCGRTLLSAREAGVPALGYVIGYSVLLQAFDKALDAASVRRLAGSKVVALQADRDAACVSFERDGATHSLSAHLLGLADGGQAQCAPSEAVERDYRQCAVLAQVAAQLPQRARAYERFTPDGPIALLPRGDRYALIWTTSPERAQALCAAADADFLTALHEQFGDRLGRFVDATARASWPLSLRYARQVTRERTVLLGNAAQMLHPVAGQGFNLGLRDAWELALTLRDVAPEAIGAQRTLDAYRRRRALDRRGAILFTDALVRIFSNEFTPLAIARGAGLAALDCLPPLKRALARSQLLGFGVALAT